MSKQLFEFVKVTAGTAFPYESKSYSAQAATETPDPDYLHPTWFDKNQEIEQDIYILRPAESPDAGREHPHTTALREIETLPTGDPFHAMVKARQIARKAIADVPATNVGDIPAGREGLYIADIEFGNNLPRPIPADPGSQVEAVDPVKLLEWINEKYLVFEKGSEQRLITLYKQSLNEKS